MIKDRKPLAVLVSAAIVCMAAASCSLNEYSLNRSDTIEVNGRPVPASGYEQGMVRLLLSEELVSSLGLEADSSTSTLKCSVKSVNDAISSLGIVRMERTFPYAGKFEARTRAEGLHLWYDVYFDENAGLTKASAELSSIDGVRTVEYRPKMVRISSDIVPGTVTSSPGKTAERTASGVFDDPYLLTEQWHYINDGTYDNRAIAGSDINVLPVWQKGIVGSEDVIVSVVDGGIDFKHEDLADNMWSDPEISDPDYSHGYNFVRKSYLVTADDHGTHVAGTVAAVNNNGIGVCGVAGGDKAAGIGGVKLMSCQIFEGNSGAQAAPAIKWGADHGAVISQNSWGYDVDSYMTDTPPSDKAAIDYFIKYAGFDENGNQVGPMAGGVVIFAAGNDEVNYSYPGSYESCIAVSAIAADYVEAYYTNYGDWVDVAAPGGDRFKNELVYSTLPDNQYGGMEGTSMACPHVSGLAALLVSRYGGQGFTNAQLREMIEGSTRDISEYTDPSKYIGLGLVDAEKAMSMASTTAPNPVTDLNVSAHSNFIDFTLTIPADEDDGTPAYATLHYSTSSFDPTDSILVNGLPFFEVSLAGMKAGDEVTGSASGLEFNTTYYVSASVRDQARNRSALYPEVLRVTTGSNTAPVLTPGEDISVEVRYNEVLDVDFRAEDADGHSLTASVTEMSGVSVSLVDAVTVRLTLNGEEIEGDSGTLTVTVSDGFGGEDAVNVHFTVIRNTPPELTGTPGQAAADISSGESTEVDMAQFFLDKDSDQLTYTASGEYQETVEISFEGNMMVLTPVAHGRVTATVTASDKLGETVSMPFDIIVRDAGKAADFFPNPVLDNTLYVRTGQPVKDAYLKVSDAYGKLKASRPALDISLFEPESIDLTGLPGGVYQATLEWTDENGKKQSITSDFAKL